MADQQNQQFVDFIDMRLNDPELEAWDGRALRVDPGFYTFEVDEATVNQSRNGNPTLELTFRVLTDGDMQNRTLRRKYAIMPDNDGARARMKSLILALQAQTDPEGRFSAAGLKGLQMEGEVVLRTFDTVDPRSGQPVTRETSDIIGEAPVQYQQAAGQQAGGQQAGGQQGRSVGQSVGQPVAARRPGNAQPRR